MTEQHATNVQIVFRHFDILKTKKTTVKHTDVNFVKMYTLCPEKRSLGHSFFSAYAIYFTPMFCLVS